MHVTVRGRHIDMSEPLRLHAERRTRFATGAFHERIESLDICIADVNGPRGGVDKRCAIVVTFRSGGSVLARGVDADAYFAVDRAAARVRTLLARRNGVRTASRRPAHRPSAGSPPV